MEPTTKTIRERILTQLGRVVTDSLVGYVQQIRRPDALDVDTYDDWDVVIEAGEDKHERAGIGNFAAVRNVMNVSVASVIAPVAGVTQNADKEHTKRCGMIKDAVMNDPLVVETDTSVRLAVVLKPVGTDSPEWANGMIGAAVVFEVTYDHDHGNSARLGTAILPVPE